MDALLPALEDLVRAAAPDPPRKNDRATRSVVFADLVGSTARKLELGHKAGVMAATLHNRVCRAVVEILEGEVLKEMGDGVLAVFEDPLKALLAGENMRTGLALYTDLATKVGITVGMVDLVEVDGHRDALGGTVDRAARIQSAAAPNQLLVDRAQLDAVGDYLGDVDELSLGASDRVPLRGIGELELWPIESTAANAAPPRLPERLRVYGSGRLPIGDKLRFMRYARDDVVEFGTGLTTFAGYFTSLNPNVWKTPVRDLLDRGVTLRCFALNPDSDVAHAYYQLRDEQGYAARASEALTQLIAIREEFRAAKLEGEMEIFTYSTLPSFYALAVDLDSDEGGLQVSPYLSGVPRAACPVFELSRAAEPELFERVQQSLRSQIAGARPVE